MNKLPFKTFEREKDRLISLFQKRLHQKSVLIVEDDDLLKPFFANILYSVYPKIKITWARNSSEAKSQLNDVDYNLIISDCLLADGENGVDLWKYCQQSKPYIPFLMISGLKLETINKYIAEIGNFNNFLQKPFNESECRQFVSKLIA